ncbi:glycoside hydrolase family 127 protein [Parabacteroides sp. FAFU027]|uniref:glycoside hydrolase family 127 protein n=1 Tax=Parabacteroides sp. FAFU027 TaxID=2922715 RepID=UPI001FAF9C69|nr:glycoside hydrolase family 127 protein [Parabacteroides sp. FAFU027]
MRHTLSSIIICTAVGLFTTASAVNKPAQPIKQVPFTQVHFTDNFWAPRIEINRTVSIPSAFKECEKNGRFDNFALAGKLIKGEHKGDFSFDDTDPYKIIEGASYSLAVKYDKKLDAYLDSVINLIGAAQEPDGYLTTCVTNKCTRLSGWWGNARWEKINSHELYNCGHMYEAAIAHFQATGKRTFLNIAIKNADLICKVFGPNEGQIHRPSGHPIVEMALAKLYKVTGTKRYLDLAKYFVEETGRGTDGHRLSEYSQDHMPILKQDEIKGHAVRAGYLYSGVADVAALTNDKAYFDALTRIWENMVSKKMFITGGIGSRAQGEGFGPNYELYNHTAYCETCAAIANVYWNERMFLATGDAKYIDVLERALYNGVISGVSLSGNKFFYDNPLESMGQHDRQPWFGCACCPGNITRFMASAPGYAYATQANDILVNLYVQSNSKIKTATNTVQLNQTSQYPWDGDVKISVKPLKPGNFAIKLRIPGWAKDEPVPSGLYKFTQKAGVNYQIWVNGKKIASTAQNGYAVVSRNWKSGDVIELKLPMPVRRIQANPEAKDDQGKLAIERGPIMYCLEGWDQGDKHIFNKYIPENAKMEFRYQKDLLNGVGTLSGTAIEVAKDNADKLTEKEVPFMAIPYSTWDNRGSDEMAVWIPASANYARPVPEPTIASKATSVNGYGFNDQWEPKSSNDISKPYHYWWLKKGSEESIEYAFEQPETVSNVQVYWLDLDHYDGDFRIPESWKLYYKDGEEWKEVQTAEKYTTLKDCYNKLNFTPVKTTGLKIVAKLQKGESGGVLEWKVN